MKNSRLNWLALVITVAASLQGCAVVAVADAAVTATATVVGVGVRATGAVVDAVIPGSSEDDTKKNKK
ncbi:MAG: hypothetical protein RLY30_440 [Pseudomonadota bacterium]